MKLKKTISFCLFTGGMLYGQLTLAQTPEEFEKNLRAAKQVAFFEMNKTLGSPSFIAFNKGAGALTRNTETIIRQNFAFKNNGEQLVLFATTTLKSGIEVKKYKMVFNGVPVEHSAYIVNSQNGEILSVSSESYRINAGTSTTPRLDEASALQKALSFVNAGKYAWQSLEEDKALVKQNPGMVQQLEQQRQQRHPKGTLVFAKDVYGSGQARLAWKYDIYAAEPLSRHYIYVDAETGKILLADAIIKHTGKTNTGIPKTKPGNNIPGTVPPPLLMNAPQAPVPFFSVSVPGTAQTRYAGTRSIQTTKVTVPLLGAADPNNPLARLSYSGEDPRTPVLSASVYILKDDTRGGGIETYDMNAVGGLPVSVPSLYITALAFVDIDNNWKNETGLFTHQDHVRGLTSNGSVGADEALNDDYAFDAHWGAEMVYDYWKNRHGRLSFDNNNAAIKSYVHYGPAYDNAFWDGSQMTYGDGTGTSVAGGFRPLTSLDVCGHEIGHGVCSFTSDLVYAGESGAMNEGLSDIWGASIENYVNTPPLSLGLPYFPFQIGEQISANNTGLRRMDAPKANSNPDTYGGLYWTNPNCTPSLANDQCGVHSNSGVLNKYFYLLVNGPAATTGSPAVTDDGRADAGTAAAQENTGNIYAGAGSPIPPGEFAGIGFLKAEAITYLMELNLTPNATFSEARTAAINAARLLYGNCSQEEKTVTNAWYAVNVGANFSPAGCAARRADVVTAAEKENGVKIYPNITTDYATVQGVKTGQTIYIFSAQGKVVSKIQVAGSGQRINLGNFSDGEYFISVTENDQKIFTGKVVKRR